MKTPEGDLLQYESFCKAMFKWHQCIYSAAVTCLKSSDYVQIRNAILILDKIRDYHPLIRNYGESLFSAAQDIMDKEERQDLKQLGTAYYGRLKNQKERSTWMSIRTFKQERDPTYLIPDPPATPKVASEVNSPAPEKSSSRDMEVDTASTTPIMTPATANLVKVQEKNESPERESRVEREKRASPEKREELPKLAEFDKLEIEKKDRVDRHEGRQDRQDRTDRSERSERSDPS
ncbi:transcription factor/nuclear export subunit protein 2-domain-containing protein [Chytridium lagenaria]|nr:transcription factor/nuclear export subunit protein 2-domain-containing protein [Chytridium lagenaria]